VRSENKVRVCGLNRPVSDEMYSGNSVNNKHICFNYQLDAHLLYSVKRMASRK
jgi:hypothetical protein